ncbi:MAG: PAS domain S-box protein [Candidatus Electrothrix sp. AR3]|nr:PAS domain S-box protein [Candidatus Electrothrix sp. AR3]
MAEVFDKAMTTHTCEISQFIYYPPSGKLAAFIAVPVFANKIVLGVLAVQLNEDYFFHTFRSYLGLGKSGEVVAARQLIDGSIVAAGMRRNQLKYIKKEVLSKDAMIPIHQAVLGHKGAGLATDYRGRKIIAAWDFLPLLRWGMVVKIDQEEVFTSLQQQALLAGGLLLFALMLVVIAVLLATKSITDPIKELTTTVKKISYGNFKLRAKIMRGDEVGMLAKSFNDMAQKIESYRTLSEKKYREIEGKVLELQQAKERLEISEQKHTAILKRSIEGFWIVDRSGKILEVNTSFCSMLGYSHDELLQMKISDIELNESKEDIDKHIRKNIEARREERFETRHRHKDGHSIDVEISINFDSSLGNIFFCFQRDISERKRAEEELQLQAQIIANMAEGVYLIKAADASIVFTNPKFDKMFGYDAGEMVGQHVSIVNAPSDKGAVETANEIMAIIEKTGGWQGEVKNIKKDGSIFWCSAKVYRFKHSTHGEVLVSVHSDITVHKAVLEEQKRLEKELRQAQKMQSLGTLAGGIAHEFNNFLGIIILNAEMLLDSPSLSVAADRQIKRIFKAGQQAKKITSHILSFSRTSSLERTPVILQELIFEIMSFLETSLPSSIKINQQICSEDCLVFVDVDEIHQILINLCTNAAHAMLEPGTLTISLEQICTLSNVLNLKEDQYALLSVADTGVGMDSKTKELACDPFFTTKEVGKGTGMGLSLVYGIMESYKGAIEIESEQGKGTTVHLFFPIFEVKK